MRVAKETISVSEIVSMIRSFVESSPANSLNNSENEKVWADPLIGFSRGDDPLYQQYKQVIGLFHWTPLEIFEMAFPDIPIEPEELSIISWILPHTEAIKSDLRKNKQNPSEKWIRARIFGEKFNETLRRYVAAALNQSGHAAVAPAIFTTFKVEHSDRYGMAASWSERHAAYAAGLGTFGLCDGLITARGKAMRCGSVVARINLPATPRPYDNPYAYCLFYAKGACNACMDRCPANAISKSGHDKNVCIKQLEAVGQYSAKHLSVQGYGCGFCQTGVPCESRIPIGIKVSTQST
jgi:epoxyqueuosine reductase